MPPDNDMQFPASSPGVSRDGSSLRAAVPGSPVFPIAASDTMEVLSPWDEPDMHSGNAQDLAHIEDRNRNEHHPATPLRPSSVAEGSDEAVPLELDESSATELEQTSSDHSFRIQALSIPARNSEHQREESAEEVLQASLNYGQSSSPAHVPGISASLYPSLDGLDQDLLNTEEKEEITELASVPLCAAASIQEPTEEATILASTQDEELLEMKRAAYNGECSFNPAPSQDQEATVIAITDDDVHPSDVCHGAVQAEFIGHNNALFDHSSSEQLSFDHDSSYTAVEAESADDTATEATVIDSAPISLEGDSGDLPLWKVTEEARVLAAEVATPQTDQKPAAVESIDDEETEDYAVADQEAEIVEIQEEAHPLELTGAAAEAELIGTDNYFNVAVLSPQRHAVAEAIIEEDGATTYQEHEVIEEAVVIGESVSQGHDSEMGEAHASLVEGDYSSTAPSFPTKPVHSSSSESENHSIPQDDVATPVDTYDDSWVVSNTTFGSNDSSLPVAMPPPDPTSVDWLREESVPSPRTFASAGRDVSNSSTAASDSSNPSQRVLSGIARSTGNVMEALFGDTKLPIGRRRSTTDDAKGSILPRVLLPWTVIHNPSTSMYILTLQTNQKALDSNKIQEASKSLRAFSLPSEKQATSLARAWAPPRMYRFADSPCCHICDSKFAIFRRACHCRNCGVCVCKDCVTQWPVKMIPEPYNTKKESSVHVCKTCDWLCTAFRLALLEGDEDKAIALHATGNINLHSPFGNVKGELFYPVHCAVLGKNLSLLEWLVDENCCPIKSVRVSGLGKDSFGKYTPIVTSKNRSLLGIAMENESVDIVRYLVVDKGIALAGEKDVTADMLMRNLDVVLRLLPRNRPHSASDNREHDDPMFPPEPPTAPVADFSGVEPIYPLDLNHWEGSRTLSEEARDFGAVYRHGPSGFEGEAGSDHDDECIICFDNRIDCVATPCGHQICCLQCSNHISRCPVCAANCSFMRVFKP